VLELQLERAVILSVFRRFFELLIIPSAAAHSPGSNNLANVGVCHFR